MSEKRLTALITGATSGIGMATAKIFAEGNINLIICGRREERLIALQKELSTKIEVHWLAFDIANRRETEEALTSLNPDLKNIDILVNNAGNAHGLSSFEDASLHDFDQMMDTNVKGLYTVSKIVTQWMIAQKKGHIINVGSIAGKEVYPNGNGYCASKFAVDALTKAMRIDLLKYGIKVSAIHPGMVNTEFSLVRFKGDREKADHVYDGLIPLSSEDVADAIYFMASRADHVNIADLVLFPKAQASSMHTHRTTAF